MLGKKILFWTIAALVTIGASVYQRMTGPTHPARLETTIGGQAYRVSLPRSGGETDCIVSLPGLPAGTTASLFWRKYPSADAYMEVPFSETAGKLSASLPVQPVAGKLQYYILINSESGAQAFFRDDPLIIRFKGHVPAAVLIPHILFMFGAMLLACYGGIAALAGWPVYRKYMRLTLWTLLVGGFVFGPLVQHYAFGIYWSGFPMGGDLTDNKTLIGALAVLAAVLTARRPWNRWVAVAAVLALMVVFSIPHSLRGSELDHDSGRIGTSAEK